MRESLLRMTALTLLVLLLPVVAATAGERVALVIGNSQYQHASVLTNTLNDAQAVAEALQKLGFALDGGQAYRDLSKTQLEQVLKAFSPRARNAEAVVVYYAGYGVESGREHYLVPVDAELQHEANLTLETVALDTVLDQIAGVRGWRLVILDACRNNPLAARMARSASGRGVTRGLERVEPTGQTYIAYATKDGTEALDQDPAGSDHSPFTAVLLEYLGQSLPLERLFGAVREDVLKRTGGRQEPWLYGAPGRDPIYLSGGGSDRELVFWGGVKDSRNPAVFRIYLERYPNGTFAKLAHIRLAELEPPKPPVTLPPVVSPPPVVEPPKPPKPEPPPPPAIGREAVWNPPKGKWRAIESECALGYGGGMTCIASGMKRAGASPQAIAFTELMDKSDQGIGYMSSFKETGTVDVAEVTRSYTLRPSTSSILINGVPNIIELPDYFRKIDLKKDRDYRSFAKKFPKILLWTDYHDFEKIESLPQGGQRFIFKVIMLNGCHACEIAGWARIAFDFDQSGRLIATNLIGLIWLSFLIRGSLSIIKAKFLRKDLNDVKVRRDHRCCGRS